MEPNDVALKAIVLREVIAAIKPYADDAEHLKREITLLKEEQNRIIERAIEPYAREIRNLKEDAERRLTHAEKDRRREVEELADSVKRQTELAAERLLQEKFDLLGIDIKKPSDFTKKIDWLDEWMQAVGSAKKHGATVFVTIIIGATLTMLWTAFKGSILKP